MNTQELLLQLNSYTNIKNENLAVIASTAKALTESFENSDISADEYKELLQDLELSKLIVEDAAELSAKEELNKLIDIAITVASLPGKVM